MRDAIILCELTNCIVLVFFLRNMFLLAKNVSFYFGMSLPKKPGEEDCTYSRGPWFLGAEALTGPLSQGVGDVGSNLDSCRVLDDLHYCLRRCENEIGSILIYPVPSVWGWFVNKLTKSSQVTISK